MRVQRTKAGKGGKLVTAISGLETAGGRTQGPAEAAQGRRGHGRHAKAGVIELQGDQVATALTALAAAGYRPEAGWRLAPGNAGASSAWFQPGGWRRPRPRGRRSGG